MNSIYRTRLSLISNARDHQCPDAWEELLEQYRPYVASIVNSMKVPPSHREDAIQQVFVELWKSINRYKPVEKGKFRHWLATVTRYQVIDFIRYHASRQKTQQDFKEQALIDGEQHQVPADIDALIEEEWCRFITRKALSRIKDNFSPMALTAFKELSKGKTPQEIAQCHAIKVDSVYKYSARIKKRMKTEVEILTRQLDF